MAVSTPTSRKLQFIVPPASHRIGLMLGKGDREQMASGAGTSAESSLVETSDLGTDQLSYEILLERPESGVASDESTFVVPASIRPTQVTVIPTLAGKNGPNTDEYKATMRRRKFRKVAELLGEVVGRGSDEQFLFIVDATIKKCEEALHEVADALREGNTREIVRTLLNTLRNGGWERYRDPVVTKRVQAFVTRLGNAEWIHPAQVEEFHSLVEELKLDSMTLPLAQWPE